MKFFMHVAHGRGSVSSDSILIRYVLPVLQLMSYFHTMGPMCVLNC